MPTSQCQDNPVIHFSHEDKQIQVNKKENILDAANRANVKITSTCGGRGICKSCVIRYKSDNAPEPSEQDQFFFSKSKLAKGWRRACQSQATSNSTIAIPKRSRAKASRLFVSSEDIWVHPETGIIKMDITLQPPGLEDNRSDGQRLIEAVNQEEASLCETIDFHLLKSISSFLQQHKWMVQAIINKGEIIGLQPVDSPILGLAIDLGTTNLAVLLVDLTKGNTLASVGIENPLKKFGADIIARISQANGKPEILLEMHRLLIHTINEAATKLCKDNNVDLSSICDLVAAGNTAMHHLFLGLSVDNLGVVPFTAVINQIQEIKARELGISISAGAYVHLMDNIAGFVGGDHTAMLMGIRADIEKRSIIALDIGTNTEISLIHQNKIHSLSSPSGPALEGGNITYGMKAARGAIEIINVDDGKVSIKTIGDKKAIGICGSAVLDAVAEFFQSGDINFRGQITKGSSYVINRGRTNDLCLSDKKPGVTFTQEDVRNVQLAKAAIRAGIDYLLEKEGLQAEDLDKIVIAGAFGAYIRIESAIKIGMLPNLPIERFEQVGNAASIGAKLALVSLPLRKQARKLAASVVHYEQAASTNFMDRFVSAIHLPKN